MSASFPGVWRPMLWQISTAVGSPLPLCAVVYEVLPHVVLIVAIAHQRRKPG